jgi:hypothetical protein
MMARFEGVPWLELETDDVVKQSAVPKLPKRRELIPQILEELSEHMLLSSLVRLLLELPPDECQEGLLVPGEPAQPQ